jgi:nucleoside-diphosphate-sugar epimerase
MPALVTGATGLLGSHLVDLLLERDRPVRILARPGTVVEPMGRAGVEVCWGDLGNAQSLVAAVKGVECVFHCAARTGPWGVEAEYEATNVRGLATLVDAALAAGVERFVHVSSITVHGNDVRGVADETASFRIEPNPYSRTKVAGERLLADIIRERHAPVTIVRPGWIYGPRDVASFARFATRIQRGGMVVIGRGDNHVPLIYVRDVAQGMLLASQTPLARGRAYLLVNDEPVTQSEYLGAIAKALGVPSPSRHIGYRFALAVGAVGETVGQAARWNHPPLVMRYGVQLLGGENRFDVSRARRELGFAPQVDLAEGVRQGVAWYRMVYRAQGA